MTNIHNCQGITKSGSACKRSVSEGKSFCHQHDIVVAPEATEFPQATTEKGELNMGSTLYHFLRESSRDIDGFNMRVVTNMPTESEAAAYWPSSLSHGPQQIGNTADKLLAVDIGSQTMPLFMHRAVEMGIGFRYMSVPVSALKGNTELVEKWMSRSNFAWASPATASFIKFDGVSTWGLEPLGLMVKNHPKLAKRLNEVARVTSYEYEGPVVMTEFVTPDGVADSAFDGMNVISQSFARKLGFKDGRGQLRVLCPAGLIKGDFLVVPDGFIKGELVYHTENLKSELATDGWTLVTCMGHSPMHELRHDDQSRSNFEFFITHRRVMDDLNTMVRAFKTSVEDGGDLAEYLVDQSQTFEDPIAVDFERFGTAQRIEEQAKLLKEFGIAPGSFSNITYTRLGAIVRKMEASRIEDTPFFKRMPIPASNSMLGAITTYESATMMGNVVFPYQDGTETFFDSRYGIIMPASRFEETYHLHGGWDLDDTVGLFLTKVYCSDAERLIQLKESGVLAGNIEVPVEEADAIEVGLMIRRPNGPGEYSIEKIDASAIPWLHYDAARVEVVDLADAPYDQKSVFANTEITGITPTKDPSLHYTSRSAMNVILAQMENPGIGGMANLLIAWTSTFGVGDVPTSMIGSMETMIDACQQTSDIIAFEAIRDETRRLWIEFAKRVVETGTPVDRAILLSRVPQMVAGKVPIGGAIVNAGLLKIDAWTRINSRFNEGISFCKKLAGDKANAVRLSLPLAQNLSKIEFDPAVMTGARDLLSSTNRLFKESNSDFLSQERQCGENAVLRRSLAVRRRMATESLMDRIVDSIESRSTDTDLLVLAMYKVITTPRTGWENGEVDRIFVQPSTEGHTSLMELFVKAVSSHNILPV